MFRLFIIPRDLIQVFLANDTLDPGVVFVSTCRIDNNAVAGLYRMVILSSRLPFHFVHPTRSPVLGLFDILGCQCSTFLMLESWPLAPYIRNSCLSCDHIPPVNYYGTFSDL